MLRLLAILIGIANAQSVTQPPSYLIYSSRTLCLQRSQQMCQAMGCDGMHTIYWWDCGTSLNAGTVGPTAVPAGSYAMRVQASGQFGPTASNLVSNGTQGLSAQEQSSLVSAAAIAPIVCSTTANATNPCTNGSSVGQSAVP